MDQLICASLFHLHCWYEVDMLKVPAKQPYDTQHNAGDCRTFRLCLIFLAVVVCVSYFLVDWSHLRGQCIFEAYHAEREREAKG